jgi:hypothetical protein
MEARKLTHFVGIPLQPLVAHLRDAFGMKIVFYGGDILHLDPGSGPEIPCTFYMVSGSSAKRL